jgi:manganese/zinc/iron transport system ATP- binding protein
VVHHDLSTVPDYFDWVTLLNVRRVAHGSVPDVFTEHNLGLAYGGKVATAFTAQQAAQEPEAGRYLHG